MKRTSGLLKIIALAAIIGIFLSGCASVFFSVSIRSVIGNLSSVRAGGTINLRASGRDIVWSVGSLSDATGYVAGGTFITQNGVLTVDINETALFLYVKAASTRDDFSDIFRIRVVTVTSVSVTAADQVAVAGRTLQFRAQVSGNNDPDSVVTWSVSSNSAGTGAVSQGTSINSSGLLTVAGSETLSALYITATSVVDPSKTGSAAVSVVVPTVTNVAVSPANQTIRAGTSLQFSASVTGTYSPPGNVTWRVSSNASGTGAVTPGTSISSNGTLTVANTESLLTLYIIATSSFDPSKSGYVTAMIITPTITDVVVGPANQTVSTGASIQFNAAVRGTNNPETTVIWRVSSNAAGTGAVTQGTTISGNGLLTVSANETSTILYIIATSTFDPSKYGSIPVSVNIIVTAPPVVVTPPPVVVTPPPVVIPPSPTVTSVTVSPANQSIQAGGSIQFGAIVNGTNNPSTAVTWRVSSNAAGTGAVAAGTNISAGGLLTISANEAGTTLYVTATSAADTTKSGSAVVTVNAQTPTPAPVTPSVSAVTVNPSARTMERGSTFQFSAVVTGTNNPGTAVTWRVSSNTAGTGAVAAGTSISAGGLLTVSANETMTTLYVTATSSADTTKSGSATVTVNIPAVPIVTSVTVSPSSRTMERGSTFQFSAAVTGTNNPGTGVTWRVSSNTAGTGSVTSGTSISSGGLLTVSANETITTLYVTATSTVDTTKSGSATVTVNIPVVPTVTSVTVSPSSQTITRGNTQQFSAAVTGTNNPGTGVTWRVSSNTAGTGSVTSGTSISSGGLLTVSANETMTTLYVTATSTVDTTKSGSAAVTVNIPAAVSVSVSPATYATQTNTTVQLSASVTGTSNTAVVWSVSSNINGTGDIAPRTTISATGLLTVAPNEWNPYLYVFARSTADSSIVGRAEIRITNNNENQGSNQGS